jgi:hypothetical protein
MPTTRVGVLRDVEARITGNVLARCRAIEEACRRSPQTAAELVPVMFHRIIDDPHQMGFAFSEVLAHVNFMLRENRLAPVSGTADGVAFTA